VSPAHLGGYPEPLPFQVTPEETQGRRLYDLGNGQWNIPELRRLLDEVLPQHSAFDDFVVDAEFDQIGRKAMRLNARQLLHEGGRSRLILLAIEDVTEHNRLQEALDERVQELAAADRRKNEFLAMLAHELRNPLAPIRNAVFLLQQFGPSEPRLMRAREIVDRQVSHQARLLDDLLDVSRISQGKIVIRPERLDLAQLVREAVEDRRSVLEEAGLTLALELPAGPVWVEGDPTRLSQVVGNLLSNAEKFTNRGGDVSVRLATQPEERRAALTVRDTGIGIEPEMLPRIFEMFAQADRSLERTQGGMGLGLALVKGFVELQGGEVRAESSGVGRGAEFTILFPLAAPPAVTETLPAPAAAPAGPRRVLIVDDSRDTVETLHEVLKSFGHEVAFAYSGPEALKAARQFRPEVVLCDVGLPGMDGYEVAAALRRDPSTAGARLIAVTGYGQEGVQERSQGAGFDLHLTKPVDLEALQRLLEAEAPWARARA
jgi:signal transduction histidine kinase/ActR/RegA family two-component response regulator